MANEQTNTNEAAVRGIMQQYVKAWNEADSKAFGALFSDDAEFVSSLGLRERGSRGAESYFQNHVLKGEFKGTKNECQVERVQFPANDVAIFTGQWRILAEGNKTIRSGYMHGVAIRKEARWLLASFAATALAGARAAA